MSAIRNAAKPLPDDYWSDASKQTAASTSAFLAVLEDLATGKVDLTLVAGEYNMPSHMAGVPLDGEIRITGAGINQTYIRWNAGQAVLQLNTRSIFALKDLTVTGTTTGTLYSSSPGGTAVET